MSTLLAAVEGNHEEIVHCVIETQTFTRAHVTASLPVAIRSKNMEIAELLIRNGADFTVSGGGARAKTSLYLAIEAKMVAIVRLMLSYGVDSAKPICDNGFTLAHLLAKVGDVEMLALAKSHLGGDINTLASGRSTSQYTPLAVACVMGKVDAVRFLLAEFSEMIDVNFVDSEKHTPLSVTADSEHLEIVELLESGGAAVNGNSNYSAPLYLAAGSGHLDVVRFLCEHGATINSPPGTLSVTPQRHLHAILQNCNFNGNIKQIVFSALDKPPGRPVSAQEEG